MTWQTYERAAHLEQCLRLLKAGPGWRPYVEDKAARLESDEGCTGLLADVRAASRGPCPVVEGVNVGTPFRIPASMGKEMDLRTNAAKRKANA
jgi:hypothetical protein